MNRMIVIFMKKMLVLILPALMIPAGFGFADEVRHKSFSSSEIDQMAQTRAVIKTRLGDITLEFFPDSAPNHVHNFITLAKSGFYDGSLFHRVIPKFMIQGGDPNSKSADRRRHGTGGPGYALKAEFNNRSHKRGILSMARSNHPDSAGSQFFICVADAPFLDGKYTVFGKVVSGMAAVDQIVSQPRDKRDNPTDPIKMDIDITVPEPSGQETKP